MGWSTEITGTLNPTGSGIVEIDASSGGVHNFNAGSTVTGNGTFQIAQGPVNFNDTHAIAPTFSFTNGTINIIGTVNTNGHLQLEQRHAGEYGNVQRQRNGQLPDGLEQDHQWPDLQHGRRQAPGSTATSIWMQVPSSTSLTHAHLPSRTPGANGFFRTGVTAGETEPILNIIGTLTKAGGSTNVTSLDVVTNLSGTINVPAGFVDMGWNGDHRYPQPDRQRHR